MNWKEELTELKHQYLELEAPSFYAASGGRTMKLKRYSDKDTNSLTNAIMELLKYEGHYANRINCMGTVRKINGEPKFTPSATSRGTADIHALINSRHVSIEVKCAATKDRLSEDQKKEKKKVEDSGGLYIVATDGQQFFDWYHKTFGSTLETSGQVGNALLQTK